MELLDIVATTVRQAPVPGGPLVRALANAPGGAPVALLHVTIPAGGSMPEHDHGPSQVLLVPIDGRIRLRHGQDEHDLAPGAAAHIGLGELVGLANPGPTPATALVVVSPPQFADGIAAWSQV